MPDSINNTSLMQGLAAAVAACFGMVVAGIKWFSSRTLLRIDKHDGLHENHVIGFNNLLSQMQTYKQAHEALEMQVATIKENHDKAELRHIQSLKEQRKSTDRTIDAMVKNFEGMFRQQQKSHELIIELLRKE